MARKRKMPVPMTGELMHWQSDPRQDQIDGIVATVDGPLSEIERKWGVGRLPTLISADTASRYWQAMAKFDAAIQEKDVEEVVAYAGVITRAWQAMDAEAIAAGHKIMPDVVMSWRSRTSGKEMAVVHGVDISKVKEMYPGWIIWTTEELEVIMESEGMAPVEVAKAVFPGAEVTSVGKPIVPLTDAELNDEIPF